MHIESVTQHLEFDKCWKVSITRPLIKKERVRMYFKELPPRESNLSFISKLVERACLDQFMSFIENNKLLPSYQSAYRKGYSTETALVKLMNNMLHNMEHQGVTALVCIHLSAACDTVHQSVAGKC